MANAPDDRILELPCPGCSETLSNTLGWFRSHKAIDCPSCGSTINLGSAEFRDQLDAVAKAAGSGRVAFKGLTIRNR